MVLNKRTHIAISLFYLLIVATNAQSADTLKVLFVGNSYTYFWNLSQTVEELSKKQGIPLIARNSTAGGVSLKDHWIGRMKLESRKIITESDWDVVVLQNHSRSAIDSLEDFIDYGNRFIKLVKSTGAEPILYETWARKYNPLMQEKVSKAYNDLARINEIEIVPVGSIWQMARELRPGLQLFDQDGSHPSPLGTYLNACVFFSSLNKQQSSGLPERVTAVDKNGEILYLSIQSINDASFIQEVVDRYLQTNFKYD